MQSVMVTRTYLELCSPADLNGCSFEDPEVRIEAVRPCASAYYRFLYTEVGRAYHWTDRLSWTDAELDRYLSRPEVSLYVLYHRGSPGGYFELEREPDGSIRIAYFGLMPTCIGRGWGKALLTAAVRQAWTDGAARVWLHTCTLDDPAALPNYLNRGFRPFREEVYEASISSHC